MNPPYITTSILGVPDPAIRLSSGKVIYLTQEEYLELRSLFVPPPPVYAPMPMPPHNPLAPDPYMPTITC